MKAETKTFNSIDFREPPFKGVFVEVKNRLKTEYDRNVSADAVRKAYNRGEVIVFELVKEEVEKCINNFERELLSKKSTLVEKRKFERNVHLRITAIEA